MNQATNLIQWKNLTDEQKAQFDFSRPELYMSQRSCGKVEWRDYKFDQPKDEVEEVFLEHVNRLKILPDEWYYCDDLDNKHDVVKGDKLINSLDMVGFDEYETLRPAKPSEIPKPEPTLRERIEAAYPEYEVVMLSQGNMFLQFDYSDMSLRHINAQSMKGFAGYVYKDNIEDGARSTHVIKTAPDGSIIHPVAVLFEK